MKAFNSTIIAILLATTVSACNNSKKKNSVNQFSVTDTSVTDKVVDDTLLEVQEDTVLAIEQAQDPITENSNTAAADAAQSIAYDGFIASLKPSAYKDGKWSYAYMYFTYNTYDAEQQQWILGSLETEAGVLNLSGNSISGTATVYAHKLFNSGAEPQNIDEVLGAGQQLSISGYINGTTVHLTMHSESGDSVSFVGAIYDGGVESDNEGKWVAVTDSWYGISDFSVVNSISAYENTIVNLIHESIADENYDIYQTPAFFDAVAFTNEAKAFDIVLGAGSSVYSPGQYTGKGYTYLTDKSNRFLGNGYNPYTYRTVVYDIDLEITGNDISGTLTLDRFNSNSNNASSMDIDGYIEGDNCDLNGTIRGHVIDVVCTRDDNPDFRWRHIWGNNGMQNNSDRPTVEAPGQLTVIEAYYGVTYASNYSLGGENEVLLERVDQ